MGGPIDTRLSPTKVNDDSTKNSQFFSAIAIDPTNGTVDLAWYDARNDHKNKKVDVYFQTYTSAGVATPMVSPRTTSSTPKAKRRSATGRTCDGCTGPS